MAKKSQQASQKGGPARGVDLPEIERVLDFMHKHGLEEIEYERDGLHIRLKKPSMHSHGEFRTFSAPEITLAGTAAHVKAPAAIAPPALREGAADAGPSEDLHIVKSPIVGTYYSSAGPGSEPFVAVGARVEQGQVLCIIEAMKLMNEIESDVAGEVVKIFVENGQPVEYGEPLFGIHPHRKK
ncbi:MAG: acetyl-CoA carboxylase biotin carboxyl carrier protein [Candidatus Acidiferrales bacterium]